MLTKINKVIRNNFIKNFLFRAGEKIKSSRRGQVAIILLVLTVIALVFYAVTLNLTRSNDTKTLVTIASNSGASLLASQMASYGQMIFKTQLGGKRKICALSGVAMALILVIVIVIAIIVIITTYGSTTGLWAALVASVIVAGVTAATAVIALVVALILAMVALIIQVAYIEPKITEAWGKTQAVSLSTRDQFLERAIISGLQGTVGDKVRVPDFNDLDQDGFYGYDLVTQEPKDNVSRFAYYYTQRLKTPPPGNVTEIEEFKDALNDLVRMGVGADPDWGFYDQGLNVGECAYDPASNVNIPSECNRCCTPLKLVVDPPQYDPETGLDSPTKKIRDRCCDCNTTFYDGNVDPVTGAPKPDCDPGQQCGTVRSCTLPTGYTDPFGGGNSVSPNAGYRVSPFSDINPNTSTPFRFVFNPLYENRENNDPFAGTGISFKEALGRDDENKYYMRDLANIDDFTQLPLNSIDVKFRIEDTTGYMASDKKPGIFSYFYKLQDWATDLTQLDPSTNPTQCFWCDSRSPQCDLVPSTALPPDIYQLSLTSAPTDPDMVGVLNTLPTNNLGWCVDKENVAGQPPLRPDVIRNVPHLEAPSNQCIGLTPESVGKPGYVQPFDDAAPGDSYPEGNLNQPFWKRGMNNYCGLGDIETDINGIYPKDVWPYYSKCAEDINNYTCNADNTYDAIDGIVTDLETFLVEVQQFLDADANAIAMEFPQVYDAIATWIEAPNNSIWPGCYMADGATCQSGQSVKAAIDDDPFSGPDPDNLDDPDPPVGTPEGDINQEIIPSGMLPRLSKQLGLLIERLRAWEVNDIDLTNGITGDGYFGAACLGGAGDDNTAWCMPQQGLNCLMSTEERNFIYQDHNGNGVQGDVSDVIACLDYHIEGLTLGGGLNPANTDKGDYYKFDQCATTCSIANCSNLPRSLYPLTTYDPDEYRTQSPFPNSLDQTDVALFMGCLNNCDQQACTPLSAGGLLPNFQTSNGAPYNYPITPWPGANTCTTGWSPGFPYYDMIADNLVQAGGPKCSLDPGGWLNKTQLAAKQAEQQTEKFKLRREFLQQRLDEVERMITLFSTAKSKIDAFLTCDDDDGDGKPDGAACRLVRYRQAYDSLKPQGLPYQAIYAWRDDDQPGGVIGRWHVVRIDARIPGRCDFACGHDGDRNNVDLTAQQKEKRFPRVRTYNKSMKRCYALADTDGFVKFRVTRYDQPPPSARVLFPNGRPIWDFRSFSPNNINKSPTTIETDPAVCQKLMERDDPLAPLPLTIAPNHYRNAVMLNERKAQGPVNDPLNPDNNVRCWDLMTQLLAQGVSSETCAMYYYKEGARKGFTFKFVDCSKLINF